MGVARCTGIDVFRPGNTEDTGCCATNLLCIGSRKSHTEGRGRCNHSCRQIYSTGNALQGSIQRTGDLSAGGRHRETQYLTDIFGLKGQFIRLSFGKGYTRTARLHRQECSAQALLLILQGHELLR